MTEMFGQLDSEKIAQENLVCREIVKTINDFGVNQRQILTIIRLLAFELENMDDCREIVGLIDSLGQPIRVTDLAQGGE